jgi:protein-tyrosine phosphatase
MKKILMVCLGNICRSPMAEGIMKHHLEASGIEAYVDSAGTSGWHEGEPPDHRATITCRNHGIEISSQRSRPFAVSDFDRFDLIFAMDHENYRNLINMTDVQGDRAKVSMIMNVLHPGSNKAVPDPYFGGDEGFEVVFHMLDSAAQAIIRQHFQDETE